MESQIDCCSKKFGLGDYSNHLHDSHNDSCPKCEVLFHQNSEEEIIKHVRSCDPNEIVQESIYFLFSLTFGLSHLSHEKCWDFNN